MNTDLKFPKVCKALLVLCVIALIASSIVIGLRSNPNRSYNNNLNTNTYSSNNSSSSGSSSGSSSNNNKSNYWSKSYEFGTYPQTNVLDPRVISTLNTKAGALPTESNSYSWTSYGYYIEEEVSDYMWYIDIEESGEKYRGVYFVKYRPNSTYSKSSYSWQDDNGYYTNTVYWFKYEPIKWTIVKESNGYATLVCDIAIDSQQFDYDSNNYKESTIRKWLNEIFYNTAFNELQKSIIQITTVDNSASSTGSSSNSYACANTQDKVYLLSGTEATTYYTSNTARQKKSSDYAQSQGCYESTSSSYLGNCFWWLRSPDSDDSGNANGVHRDGYIYYDYVHYTYYGVVPALKIKL